VPTRISKRRKKTGKAGEAFERLVALQARLRAPDGCPWDRVQTHESLRTFLIEETYEVLDALDSGGEKKFASELGDLLLQIVFHAELAREKGRFDISDVIEGIHNKLVRRHPHVFGKVKARTPGQVLKNWEQLKAEERQSESKGAEASGEGGSLLDGVPRTLPALLEAHQLTRRAANIGFDWKDVQGLLEKLKEEASELRDALAHAGDAKSPSPRVEEEAGDLLFVAVNVARFLGVDPEIALKKANRKFATRFRWMEQQAARNGRQLAEVPRQEMENLWERSKDRM